MAESSPKSSAMPTSRTRRPCKLKKTVARLHFIGFRAGAPRARQANTSAKAPYGAAPGRSSMRQCEYATASIAATKAGIITCAMSFTTTPIIKHASM
eukprot:127437-Prymnesium_polylepis.2